MSLDTTAVRVAGTGEIYYAASGTAAPTTVAALGAGWTGLGYTTTDGVTFTLSRDTSDIDGWQGSKLRVVTNSEPKTVAFSLLETDTDSLLVAFGGGTVGVNGGVSTYTPPVEGTNTIRSLCVDFTDGTITNRYYFPRVQLEGDVSFSLTRSAGLAYAVTFGVLAGTPAWQLLSNDTTHLTYGS